MNRAQGIYQIAGGLFLMAVAVPGFLYANDRKRDSTIWMLADNFVIPIVFLIGFVLTLKGIEYRFGIRDAQRTLLVIALALLGTAAFGVVQTGFQYPGVLWIGTPGLAVLIWALARWWRRGAPLPY